MFEDNGTTAVGALRAVFEGYEGPVFAVRLWNGLAWCSSEEQKPACTIVVGNRTTLRRLIASPNEVTLGEAFIRGDLDVEGDIFSVFAAAEHLFRQPQPTGRRILEKLANAGFNLKQRIRLGAVNSRRRDRASIAYHYDQPVAFYQPWLGDSMAYSCAYFTQDVNTLDEAQQRKLALICRKLCLQPGERFLDIGCGWGSLMLEAAHRSAVVHGITLSCEQAETTWRRIRDAGYSRSCSVELRDYRHMEQIGQHFDKIASVGMYEHVGLKNLTMYFGIAYRLLRPGGLFLNHGIARASRAPARESSFIGRYVFPDGKLVTLPEAIAAAESQGFEVRDVECLREHYEITLRRWVEGLTRHRDELLKLVPLSTYRIWLLYMAGSAAAFRRGDIGVYQVLLSKPDHGQTGLPLTREDVCADPQGREKAAVRDPGDAADLPQTARIGDT